jgi:hypothetical protein
MSCIIVELNGDVSSIRQKESKRDEPDNTFACSRYRVER